MLGIHPELPMLPVGHGEVPEDDALARVPLGDLPEPPLDLLHQPGVHVFVGSLQDVPPLLGVLDLPGETPRVVDEVDEPLEARWLDVLHPDLPEVPVRQGTKEHALEHWGGDGEHQLVRLKHDSRR